MYNASAGADEPIYPAPAFVLLFFSFVIIMALTIDNFDGCGHLHVVA